MLAISPNALETEISGTPADLRQLRDELIALAAVHGSDASIAASYAGPSISVEPIAALVVRHTSGPTLVTIDGASVIVEGSGDSLVRFASWFEFPTDAQTGAHVHFEPMAGDMYHSPDSVPLVISVREADV